jgi:two-component system sensor histidine kinase MtrB
MMAYGLLALGLSAVLAVATWTVVSQYLIDQRISSAIVETADNARVLENGLAEPRPAVAQLVGGLPSTDSAASMLSFSGQWFSASTVGGPDQLPPDLVATVRAGSQAHRRIEVAGQQVLAVGVPLTKPGDAFVELHPLASLDGTLRTLSITLVLGALVTSVLGLAVGRLASTLALRPLAELTDVGAAVARGQLSARLDAENDPDLGGLARSFNQTAATLEQRVAADARFAGDISHELRTPLTTMLNSMQVIQNRRSEIPPAVREPLELLADDLERFRRLVLDLLEISRHDGGDDGSRETVRISDLVRAAADATAGRQVTVVEPDAAELTLQADKRRLERVIANLVENAGHHGGGCKGVTVCSGGLGVIVYVDDAGPGVPPDNRDRIFERFGRGANDLESGLGAGGRAADGHRQGIGLGLAIVASHVQWHGGTIRVEDRPGGGARFIVELPAKPA